MRIVVHGAKHFPVAQIVQDLPTCNKENVSNIQIGGGGGLILLASNSMDK